MMRYFIICILSIITVNLFAQVSSSSMATATVVNEIGITQYQANDLITIASYKNEMSLLNTSGVKMLTNTNTVEILSFKVISNENEFSISLPLTSYRFEKNDDKAKYLTAELFVTPTINKKNNQPISITSIINANNLQSPGNYYSPPLEITVNYN